MTDDGDGRRDGEQRDPRLTRRQLLLLGALATSGAVAVGTYLDGRDDAPRPDRGTPTPTSTRTAEPTTRPTEDTATAAGDAADRDFIYNTAAEMRAIEQRVSDGDEPWATGYRRLERAGEEAMTMTPRSVVDRTDDDYPRHRFVARVHDRDDYRALKATSDAVLDLGLLYYFTERDRYAERAIDLLHHWCLDPETYMAPDGDAMNVGPELRLHILTPKLWWGASFLRDHPHWTDVDPSMPWTDDTAEDAETAFRAWVRALMTSMPPAGYAMRDNHWSWRLAFYSSAAAYLGEEALLKRIFEVWRAEREVPKGKTVLTLDEGSEFYADKDRPWNDFELRGDGSGYMAQELAREEAFFYTVFNLEALSLTAEVARVRGVDLYSFNAPTDPLPGSTMRKLFTFMAPYAADPSAWQWGNGSSGITSGDWHRCKSVFELACSRWPAFEKAVIGGDLDRPFHSYYVLRHPTLTHAARSELDV